MRKDWPVKGQTIVFCGLPAGVKPAVAWSASFKPFGACNARSDAVRECLMGPVAH